MSNRARPAGWVGLSIVALGGVLAPAAAGAVPVVDPAGAPGADHTDFGLAVEAAAEGDVLLLRPGVHDAAASERVIIDGKSLVVVAEVQGPDAILDFGLVVRNLGAGQSFVARGVSFTGAAAVSFGQYQVEVTDNVGPVWFEDCIFDDAGTIASAGPLHVLRSAAVTFHRCSLGGARGTPLRSTDSEVHLYETDLIGFDGPPDTKFGASGGDAAVISGGELFAQGSLFQGGDGGLSPFSSYSGDGGDCLALLEDPVVRHLDCAFEPGLAPLAGVSSGLDGVVFHDFDGGAVIEAWPGSSWFFVASTPVREGDLLDVTVQGPPSHVFFLTWSLAPGATLLPGKGISVAVSLPFFFLPIAALPPSGALAFPFVVPELGPAFEALVVHMQAGFSGPKGELATTGGTAIVLLDAAVP